MNKIVFYKVLERYYGKLSKKKPMEGVDGSTYAARLSYNESKLEFKETTGVVIPKRIIHSFVQEIGALKPLGDSIYELVVLRKY